MAAQSQNEGDEDRSERESEPIGTAGEIDAETRARFRSALRKLPRIQRKIFRAHRQQGLSYAKIALLMGVSQPFVERQMAKAIYRLMKQMSGETLKWWERWF